MNEIIEAAKKNDCDSLEREIAKGGGVDQRDESGRTALHWAVQEGRCGIVSRLLEAGATVDATDSEGITPLALAIGENRIGVVDALIEGGADVDLIIPAFANGTVLHLACSWGQLKMVRRIVDASDRSINLCDDDKMTPLAFAFEAKAPRVVHFLLVRGAIPKRSELQSTMGGNRVRIR